MLDDSFAHFKCQVKTVETDIAVLEMLHNAQCVQVMIEAAAMLAHQFVELSFARVPERRVANVVHQRQRLDQFGVEVQSGRDSARDLRYFQGVRQAVAKMVGKAGGEDLRLGLQSPERAGMDDAVAIPG